MGLCGNCEVLKDQAETALAAAEVTFQPLCQEDPESSMWDPNADTIKNSNQTLTSFTGWTKIQSNKTKEHSGSLWQSSPSVDSRWAEQARNQIYTYRHKEAGNQKDFRCSPGWRNWYKFSDGAWRSGFLLTLCTVGTECPPHLLWTAWCQFFKNISSSNPTFNTEQRAWWNQKLCIHYYIQTDWLQSAQAAIEKVKQTEVHVLCLCCPSKEFSLEEKKQLAKSSKNYMFLS